MLIIIRINFKIFFIIYILILYSIKNIKIYRINILSLYFYKLYNNYIYNILLYISIISIRIIFIISNINKPWIIEILYNILFVKDQPAIEVLGKGIGHIV